MNVVLVALAGCSRAQHPGERSIKLPQREGLLKDRSVDRLHELLVLVELDVRGHQDDAVGLGRMRRGTSS